jgi:hypothetical protein
MRAQAIAFCFGLVLFVSVALPSTARAQAESAPKPIGKVVIVTGSVTIEHTAAVALLAKLEPSPGTATIGQSLFTGDIIQTGASGKAGIVFSDGTAFNMSSNARIVLDEFVYDPNGKSNSTILTLTKGTFTLIAGQTARTGTMKVETPVATLGIRGTTPHIEIRDDGTVAFATLIEEGKNRIPKKPGTAPIKQRKTAIQPELFKALDKNVDIMLKICSGC